MKRGFLVMLLCAGVVFSAFGAEDTETLYYAVDRGFSDESQIEFRTPFLYSNSNPHLNVYGTQLESYWLANEFVAVGVEGGLFGSSKRHSARKLEAEMDRHGYKIDYLAPQYALRSVVRATPISGYTNFFSSSVLKTDLSVTGRGGVSRYSGKAWGPSFGLGVEVGFRDKSGWGVQASVLWDWDKVPNAEWQSRTGFLVGPSLRF